PEGLLGTVVRLGRGRDEAGPQRLGQHQLVAGLRRRVGPDLLRVDDAGDGHAELDLSVAHRVSANDEAARLHAAIGPAAEDLAEPVQAELVVRVADQVQGGLRLASHRVDVAQGVGGGHLAVDERVVDNGREEIDGLNDRNLLGQLVDTGVVVRVGADKEIGIADSWYATQDLRDPLGGYHARSTGARGEINEAASFLAREKEHGWSFLRRSPAV